MQSEESDGGEFSIDLKRETDLLSSSSTALFPNLMY
jgi:hypothetical protein